jgi:ABC-type transport system involved in multi-copper enzyme maturation permease subunit
VDVQQLGLTRDMLLIAAGAAAAAVVALLLARRVLAWFLGPIFVYETMRLARKGHTFWLRTAFALLVFGLLYAAKPADEPLPRVRDAFISRLESSEEPENLLPLGLVQTRIKMQRFAEEFTNSFLLALAVVVTLVTPLYFGTAVSEEKEKRTLDFLLATRLTSRDVVLGKFAARVLNLGGLLLAAVPILAMTQVWGGVDWRRILVGFTVVFVAMLGYSAIAMLCSVISARTRNAVIAAYLWVLFLQIPPVGFLSPIAFEFFMRDIQERIARNGLSPDDSIEIAVIWTTFFAFYAAVMVVFLLGAMAALRRFATRYSGRKAMTAATPKRAVVTRPLTVAPNPPLYGDPLIWKEQYLGRTVGGWLLGRTFWVYIYLILGILLVPALMIAFEGLGGWIQPLNSVMRVACLLLQALVLLSISLRMAACVSREHEQQTLVSLFMLPVARGRLLRTKWLGTWRRARWAMAGLAMAFVATGLIVGIDPVSWFLLPLAFAAHLWFFGNFGLLLSIVSRSTNRAYSILLACLLVMVAGGWVVSYLAPGPVQTRWSDNRYSRDDEFVWTGNRWQMNIDWQTYFEELTSPPQIWWKLTTPGGVGNGLERYGLHVGLVFLSAMCYLGAGTYCWFLSLTAFRRKGGRA